MQYQHLKQFSALCLKKRKLSTTVDRNEILHFQKHVNHWWDEFGPLKGLHSMNHLRVPFIRDNLINQDKISINHIKSSIPLNGISILDVGCGGGILCEPLAKLGAEVTGIDANSKIIDIAQEHAKKSNLTINYSSSSIEDHVGKYDAVIVSEVLEHVTEKETFLKACSECIKPTGSIFITTINKTIFAQLLGINFVEDIIKLVPKGTHQYDKFIEPHNLQRILEDCNLTTKLSHGMFYNILINQWHWCSNRAINYALHAVKNNDINN